MCEVSAKLRKALGQFATGVVVVTADTGDGPAFLTVNSFNSVSLDPPLILFSIHNRSGVLPTFEKAPVIGVNILEEGHQHLSQAFAGKLRAASRPVELERGAAGALLISGALARLECGRWAVHDGGDHRIFICRVETFEHREGARPLVFFRGSYCKLGEAAA